MSITTLFKMSPIVITLSFVQEIGKMMKIFHSILILTFHLLQNLQVISSIQFSDQHFYGVNNFYACYVSVPFPSCRLLSNYISLTIKYLQFFQSPIMSPNLGSHVLRRNPLCKYYSLCSVLVVTYQVWHRHEK